MTSESKTTQSEIKKEESLVDTGKNIVQVYIKETRLLINRFDEFMKTFDKTSRIVFIINVFIVGIIVLLIGIQIGENRKEDELNERYDGYVEYLRDLDDEIINRN